MRPLPFPFDSEALYVAVVIVLGIAGMVFAGMPQ